MFQVGMYKQDLADALTGDNIPAQERIEAIALCLQDGARTAVWIALDFMDFDHGVIFTLRNAIAEKTGIAYEHVHVVTTHNHGGGEPALPRLAQLCAACAWQAQQALRPARMRYTFMKGDRKMNYIRRKFVPELDRSVTIFYGASHKDGFDAAPFTEQAIQATCDGQLRYVGRTETDRPADPFDDADDEIFLLQFCGLDGTPIGSVLRFAAHAVCSNMPGYFSSDYPWHGRRVLEEKFGGTALFFNGPCGDISPNMEQKGDGSQIRLGEYLANTALQALEEESFAEVSAFEDATVPVALPTREEVMAGGVELSEKMPEELPSRRRWLEREYLGKFMSFLREKAAENGSVPERVTIELGMLKLNGLTVVGFPGETFSVTAQQVKAAFPDREICTVTEHDRTVMYVPPVEEAARGGYESVCMTTAPGAEDTLRESAIRAIEQF